MDLRRKWELAGGKVLFPSSTTPSVVFDAQECFVVFPSADLQKKFSKAHDAMKPVVEAKKAADAEAHKISIACDDAIATQVQVQTSLKEHGVELQELHQATSEMCDHLAPPPSTLVPLLD